MIQVVTNGVSNVVIGAVTGGTVGTALMVAIDRLTDSGEPWDVNAGAAPYAISRATAPFIIAAGGCVGSAIGGLAGLVYTVAQEVLG